MTRHFTLHLRRTAKGRGVRVRVTGAALERVTLTSLEEATFAGPAS